MIPDVRTMWMVLATTGILFGFVEVCVGYRKPRDVAMVLWGWGNLAGGVGASLLSTQAFVPYALSEAAANGFLALCWGLIWAGERAFAGQRIPWWTVASGPMFLAIACMYIPPIRTDMTMRIHVVSTVVVGYLVLIAVDALRAERTERLIVQRALAVVSSVSIIPTIWRSVHIQLNGGPPDLMATTLETAMPLVWLFVMAIAINICLLLIGRERLANQLARAAVVDGLTGTLNQSGFLSQAQQAVDNCAERSRPSSVVVMDLDEFKAINDVHGHAAGDLLLAGFAATLQGNLRAEDVLGRIGGEEFCALLPGVTEPEAVDIADRLRSAFAEARFDHPGGTLVGTVSMGVAQVGADEEFTDAMQRADRALYKAKREGRDRVAGTSN